jgi:hypothetical protein
MSPRSSTDVSHPDISEEKAHTGPQRYSSDKSDNEFDGTKSDEVTYAPITGTHDKSSAPLQKQRSNASKSVTSRSLERSWSLNDGVSIGGDEVDEAAVASEDEAYTVGWEDNDPMNPRNMSKARRWLVVIIVSMGSLCVQVDRRFSLLSLRRTEADRPNIGLVRLRCIPRHMTN